MLIRPTLIKPVSGTHTHTDKDSIVVAWPKEPGWERDLEVKVSGELALKEGAIQDGYSLVHCWEDEDRVCVEMQREAGYHSGHVLVQIRNRYGRSINQHFFLKGAKLEQRGRVKQPSSYGYFWQAHNAWHLSDKTVALPVSLAPGKVIGDLCVYYPHHSFVGYLDAQHQWRTQVVPDKMLRSARQLKMARRGDDIALICLKANGEVATLFNDRLRTYRDLEVSDVGVSEKWFHANAGGRSLHLPWELKTGYDDFSFGPWWELKAEVQRPSWHMRWADGTHAWYTKRKLVAHVGVDLLTSRSEQVLWTDEDFGEPIEQVELVGQDLAVINERLLVNLATPSIEELEPCPA